MRKAGHAITQIAFARRRFKLFLRETIQDINLRVQGVAAATNFFSTLIRPTVISAPFGRSMLVVAPHQDDEIIGCGGAMALQKCSGGAVGVIVLQDGADECAQVSMTRKSLEELRNEESRAAAKVIGIKDLVFLGSKDLRSEIASISSVMKEMIESRKVDAIFVPFVLDGNKDHKSCDVIVARALRGIERPIRVFQYEVWANCIPNVVVIVDDVMEKKEEMLSCFRFANSAVDYSHATKGLNMLNSRLLPAGKSKYVEAYFEMPRCEFVKFVDVVARAEGKGLTVYDQKLEDNGFTA